MTIRYNIKLCALTMEKCPYWKDEDTKIFCNTCDIAELCKKEIK